MSPTVQNNQKGQVVVLVAIMLLAMLAMLALVLDGGNAFLQRRQAQNAADAAALAGGRTLCLSKNQSQALSVAQTYGVTNNGASSIDVTFPSTNTINVVAHINFDTFFAQLIGRPQMTASAEAAAGCFPTTSANILPVAWACHRPPITSTATLDCIADVVPFDDIPNRIPVRMADPNTIFKKELYIIMDSNSTPFDLDPSNQNQLNQTLAGICMTTVVSGTLQGTMNCDVDGDGVSDLIANGDRGWLNLDNGSGSTNDLRNWINGTVQVNISSHTWLGGSPGNRGAVYQDIAELVGRVFTVPVFDDICDGQPAQNGKCDNTKNFFTGAIEDRVHTNDVIKNASGANYYYHVIGFAKFYVTCVQTNPNKATWITQEGLVADANGHCPGRTKGMDIGSISNSDSSIEGYFVSGIIPDMIVDPDAPGLDMGSYGQVLLK